MAAATSRKRKARISFFIARPLALETPGVEVAFEQDHRRQLVDGAGAFLNADATITQDAVGLNRGPAFIPEIRGQASASLQSLSELVSVDGLAAYVAAHVQWFAEEEFAHPPFLDKVRQSIQVVAHARPMEGVNALRGDAHRVAQGEADAPLTEVEGENSTESSFRDYCIHSLPLIIGSEFKEHGSGEGEYNVGGHSHTSP